jgi:hypothetical protein
MKVSKKLAIVAGTTAVAMTGAGIAFAYISGGTGTDTQSATTASGLATALTVTVTPPSNLSPGAAASAVGVSVTNNQGYSVHFTSLAVSLGTVPAACVHASPTWIALGGTTNFAAAGGYTVNAGATVSVPFTGATLALTDDTANDQTACEGQNIPVKATITP